MGILLEGFSSRYNGMFFRKIYISMFAVAVIVFNQSCISLIIRERPLQKKGDLFYFSRINVQW